ncbi:RNA polymerase I-specific transcription initiation factor RRN6-like protein [Aspergillus crustosus]
MDETSTRYLQYGLLGKAVYNSDTRSWRFLRTLSCPPRISYTGVTKTAVEAPPASIQRFSTPKTPSLYPEYPELAAGYRFAHIETLSHPITASNEACNPMTSELLDFGRAVDSDIEYSKSRAVPIVAFASGKCRDIIAFRILTDDIVNFEQLSTTQLRVPTIGYGDAIDWLASGAPVRQICFSNAPGERATLMAARFSSTFIFRPLYHRTPVQVSTRREMNTSHIQKSRLDPNFLMEIPTSRTGGASHADAKFNPWNQSQLAIVDLDGNWGIWELRNQHRCSEDNWIASISTSGKLPWVGDEEGPSTGAYGRHDGWLAVEWVGNGNHIIVCDRRCSMLYRMESGQIYPYSIELGFKRKSEWILHMKRSSCNPSHIFILTTSRLIWFDMNTDAISVDPSTCPELSPLISWSHFRDSDDTTLQLSSLAVDEEFFLVLFSRLNRSVLAFHCSPELTDDYVFITDPFALYVPLESGYSEDFQTLSVGCHFSSLVFREFAPKTDGDEYLDDNLCFLKAFAVDSRLRVQESVYLRPSNATNNDMRSPERDILRVKHLRLTGQRQTTPRSLLSFIVHDWDEPTLGHGPTSDHGSQSIYSLRDRPSTLDFKQIYEIAARAPGLLSREGGGSLNTSFQLSFSELVNIVSDSALDHPYSRTALEISPKSLVFDDIDQIAQALGTFISQFASGSFAFGAQSYLLVLPYHPFISPSAQQMMQAVTWRLDPVAIYDHLVNHWLVGLPINIPGRARITKEKAIRHFVAELVLAQIISNQKAATAKSNTFDDERLASNFTGGVVGPSIPTNEQSLYEPLSTPIDSGLGSQADIIAQERSSLARDLLLPDRKASACPTFRALSSYTTFKKPDTLSRDAERSLNHWMPGGNPAIHSLASGEFQLAARNMASERRSRKRMSQAMKRMSLESTAPLLVSSPTPAARDWGSQPDNSHPLAIRLQSSQITDDLPMTQVERGEFGSREAAKKGGIKARKKKRAAGF